MRAIRRFLLVFTLGLASACASGCFFYTSAGHIRSTARVDTSSLEWPERSVDEVQPLLTATRAAMSKPVSSLGGGAQPQAASPPARSHPRERVAFAGILGNGLLRVFSEPERKDSAAKEDFSSAMLKLITGFHINARFLTSRSLHKANWPEMAPVREVGGDDPLMLDEGISLGFPPVTDNLHRGTIVYLPALFATKYERAVLDRLRKAGWVVVGVDHLSSITPPLRFPERLSEIPPLRQKLSQLWIASVDPNASEADRRDAQRAVEQIRGKISHLCERSFQVDDQTDLDALGRRLAGLVDDALAETAYTTQAAVEYIHRERPDLARGPIVLMGFSAGAIVLPTAAARVHDDIDAAVIIGGGGDLFAVSQESALSDGGIRLRRGDDKLDAATLARIHRAYLAATRLDPVKTAPMLRDKPVLLVRGLFDAIVPADTGARLEKALGNPDCLAFLGGHKGLFYLLPGQSDRIIGWLDRHTPKPRPDPSPRAAASGAPYPKDR